jgi:hypothetical protein
MDATVRRATLLAALILIASATSASAQPSLPRYGHSAVYDPLRRDMIVFGGTNGIGAVFNDAWSLSLGDSADWSPITPAGTLPAKRVHQTAIYDPDSDRVVVFGGFTVQGGRQQMLGDVWALSLSGAPQWIQLTPSGPAPPPRAYHSAVYDPLRHRMLVFGGRDLSQQVFSDVWSLWLQPGPRWEQLAPRNPNSVTPEDSHIAVYDQRRDRMIVYGGTIRSDSIWTLSLADSTWVPLGPSGAIPPPLGEHAAILDPVSDRMVVFGGNDGNNRVNKTWALTLADNRWSLLDAANAPPSREIHSMILDPVFRRLVVFAGLTDDTQGTRVLPVDPPYRWGPLSQTLDVSPAEIQVPVVTLGDTASATFVISNPGLDPLHVSTIQFPLPGMRLSSPPPIRLGWNQSRAETLFIAPQTPDSGHVSLVAESDDPLAALDSVAVNLRVLALDFDTRVFGDPAVVPLADSILVIVTPRPQVHVEDGTLYYRRVGSTADFDSLKLIRLTADFIARIPASAVTEQGVEYYVRVENSGFSSTRPIGAPAVLDTQRVARPTSLTAQPRPPSGTEFISDQPITVDAILPDGAIFVSGSLHFRRGGESAWQTEPLTPTGALGRPSAIVPDSMVGPRGVEYWIQATTLDTVLRFPSNAGAFDVVTVRVHDLLEPFEHRALRYRLLSVPLDFGASFQGSLYDLLSDQLGTYATTRWRAYRFDAGVQGDVEISFPPDTSFTPEPGRAFWLISRGAHRVDTKPIDGFSTSTRGEFSIALKAGWNLFGDPFDFPVAWSDVTRDTDLVGDPVRFDPTLGRAGDYALDAPTRLEPFEGYFIHANGATTMRIPAREAPALDALAGPSSVDGSVSSRPVVKDGDEPAWRIRVEARTGTASDASNELGIENGAEEGFDRHDALEPPSAPGDWTRLDFPHSDWGNRMGEYRRDLRAPNSEGETWEIEVRSGSPGEIVTVELSEIAAVPAGLTLCLIDREQGTVSRWPSSSGSSGRESLRCSVVSFGSRPYRLALAAGSSDYVTRASQPSLAVPSRVTLDATAPNPFRFATRIRFGLAREEQATLEIYSVLGQRVATLLDRTALRPGYHTSIWDGRMTSGRPAPSGVYLVRLVSGREVLTRRLVLAR